MATMNEILAFIEWPLQRGGLMLGVAFIRGSTLYVVKLAGHFAQVRSVQIWEDNRT